MPWKPRVNVARLKQAHDELARRLRTMREELQISERHRVGLEIALSVRGETIAELNGKIDRLREQNRQLDLEAEYLAGLFRQNLKSAVGPPICPMQAPHQSQPRNRT
jgi:septal ring factor EnvC (AmiA/AmiB activator)